MILDFFKFLAELNLWFTEHYACCEFLPQFSSSYTLSSLSLSAFKIQYIAYFPTWMRVKYDFLQNVRLKFFFLLDSKRNIGTA